ncbi:MAG: thioredoxin TrxC [Deltaproteobacteria bacterium]|nr:thioredoxin TrxC [Deltaproteobacteria bacterium]MBN2686542.1 thioredoxin TrxC [Deltaproteobacteria bacterium]
MDHKRIIVQCSRCNTKNRIPDDRLHDRPLCGKCGTPLHIGARTSHPVDITDESFRQEVLDSSVPVIVDCWAPWCGPCSMVAPMLDQLASEYAGRIKTAKLNVDENPLTASQFDTRSIPTLLFFKNGGLVHRMVGVQPKSTIEQHLLQMIDKT